MQKFLRTEEGLSNMSLHSDKHFRMQAERLRLRKVDESRHHLGFRKDTTPPQVIASYRQRVGYMMGHLPNKHYIKHAVDIKPKN